MSDKQFDIALIDDRPFFETVLRYGVKQGIIDSAKLAAINLEAPKGVVQIADAFGSKYLRPEIEAARKRIVNLASLFLVQTSQGDLEAAAKFVRDNTFLTLSRGGSGLIKALFAMPEYALLGREEKGRVEDFLEFWSLKEKPSEYRKALEQRQTNALEIEAGFWFGSSLGLSRALLEDDDVEAVSVIRSAMLAQLAGQQEITFSNQIEFATLLESIRAKPIKVARRGKAKADVPLADIPEKYRAIAERIQQEIITQDLPKIKDISASLDKLVYELKERYFIRDHEVEDTSDYDALVSKEWTKVTKGKTDIDSLLTMFLCISVGVAPKTSLPEKTAKTLVKKIREQGFQPALAIAWIENCAPHEKQEGLLDDWNSFLEEADAYLLDDWDTSFSGALRFLSDNCHIERAAKK
ncbi:MAG: hypothetical protein Q7T62_17880 [Undibacterium sp.]|nr:hypothetical protein [Undibacterium sp.]